MGLLKSSTPPLVGVDIGSTAIKIIQLGKSGSSYRVDHYANEPLPPNAVSEKKIMDVDAVGAAISRALLRSGSKAKHAAAAVAGSAVISKVIPMQAGLNDDEMEAQVALEAGNYIPYPIEEVNFDFEVLGPMADTPETVEVLLAASRAENVEERSAALELGGLTPLVIDIESFALENAFTTMAKGNNINLNKTIGIFEIGHSMTTLCVLDQGNSIYTREQTFGTQSLIEDIMRRYGIDHMEAKQAQAQGGLGSDYETEILEPFQDSVSQQINRLLQFFYAGSSRNTLDEIYICGALKGLHSLPQRIESNIGISTALANPLSQMSVSSRAQGSNIQDDAHGLMIATGLALRSFD